MDGIDRGDRSVAGTVAVLFTPGARHDALSYGHGFLTLKKNKPVPTMS
jgi:hypothetical protein